ncbi:hypothetical protein MIN45_P0057 [Methylomarinovum tepidoasis]|uniref:Outer membrane protein beta-barrel domain-containing protein n=1 Tax=Methylomarinovum tepidoasis TaxID=2840183 RepID=A0AAU9C5R5_9GAMM|nr:porin family protein [Methylomarinovum sp. IN45]BCX87690.1 hypothetical protein MIN45_P0057 [Methylomarinovum sp. IN45]
MKKLTKALMAGSVAAATALAPVAQAHEHHGGADARIRMLEEQLKLLKQELADLKAHSQMHHEKVMELEEWKEQAGVGGAAGESMIFFRGGYARMMTDRAKDVLPSPNSRAAKGQNGFYIGAGFEHTLSRDLFGMTEGTILEGTDLLGEVMFEYKRFARGTGLLTDNDQGVVVTQLAPGKTPETSTVTQFTLTAAPKIKFMRGSMIRPWIIPVGLGIHVISPPSDGVTVLNPGLVFGAGADVDIFKNVVIGADFRYHVTPGDDSSLNGVEDTDTDGLTAGGYVGFKF